MAEATTQVIIEAPQAEVVIEAPQEEPPVASVEPTVVESPQVEPTVASSENDNIIEPTIESAELEVHSDGSETLADSPNSDIDVPAQTTDIVLTSDRSVDSDTLVEVYNDITVSYAKAQKATCDPPVENIQDLISSLSAIVLKEFTKDHQQPEQAAIRVNNVLEEQQLALSRLASIQRRILALAAKTCKLHEDPIPRLFIVLPKGPQPLDRTDPSKNAFKLYFLCECDRHVPVAVGTLSNKSSNHIHFAKHKGHDLSHPLEFLTKYGPYVAAMLELVKYGVVSEDMIAAPLTTFKILEGLEKMEGLDVDKNNIRQKVDDMIAFIKDQLGFDSDYQDNLGYVFKSKASLSAVDLNGASSFLVNIGSKHTFGDLFRTMTTDGSCVKWVCLDHCRQKYSPPTDLLLDVINLNQGIFDEHRRKVVASCKYLATAAQLCNTLRENPGVLELDLKLQCDASMSDIQWICQALRMTNISILRLDGIAFHRPTGTDVPNKFDALVELIAAGRIQEFSLTGCDWFIDGTTNLSGPPIGNLRKLHIGVKPSGDESRKRFTQLLQRLPCLIHLSLYYSGDFDVYGLTHDELKNLSHLETLTLSKSNDQTVVLHVRSMTVDCERFGRQVADMARRRVLTTVIMPFQRHTLVERIKELDNVCNRQRGLKAVFVKGEAKPVVEVEFCDRIVRFMSAPPGQHFRGRRTDMYIRWIDLDALGFTADPSPTLCKDTGNNSDNSIVSFDSSAMSLDDTRKMIERLDAAPPTSMQIVCNSQPESWKWFAVCGLAALGWTDLSRLELCGSDMDGWIAGLRRVITNKGTPSLKEIEIIGASPWKKNSPGCAKWVSYMASKKLSSLTMKRVKMDRTNWNTVALSIKFTKLTTLDLSESSIEQEHVEKLLARVSADAPLRSLRLHNVPWVQRFSTTECEKFVADHCTKGKAQILF